MRVALALMLLACGGSSGPSVVIASAHYPQGVPEERIARLVEVATERWGLTPADLDGWTITIQDPMCPLADGRVAWGLTTPGRICLSLSDRIVKTGACLEASALVHEVGHVLDPWSHDLPGWKDREAYARAWALLMEKPEPGCEGFPREYAGRW